MYEPFFGLGKRPFTAMPDAGCFVPIDGIYQAFSSLAQCAADGRGIGVLTAPAGLGKSCLIPLMRAGFVDWIVSTGANLYHDLHYGLDMALYQGSPFLDDVVLHRDGIIRIYDILFDYHVLLDTDAFVREVIRGPEFQRAMGTDEFHYLLGKYVSERDCEQSRLLFDHWQS